MSAVALGIDNGQGRPGVEVHVYAKGSAPHAAHRVRHAHITIHQHALELDQSPAGLLAEMEGLAQQLAAVAPAQRVIISRTRRP